MIWRLLGLVLFLVAFLSGGCSLVFSAVALGDPAGDAIFPIVLVGFAVAAASFFLGRAAWRAGKPQDEVAPKE